MIYILIFYMAGYSAGGPATAQFQDKEACEAARVVIEKQFSSRMDKGGAVCVPAASAPR